MSSPQRHSISHSYNDSISSHNGDEKFFIKYFLPTQKNPLIDINIKTFTLYMKERRRFRSDPDNVLIHPYSLFSMYWEFVLFIGYFICFFLRPIYFSFYFRKYVTLDLWDFTLLFSKVIFILDIFIKLNTGYYDKNEKIIVLNKHLIRKNYLYGFFVFDLISCIPVDFFFVLYDQPMEYYYYCQLLNLFRLVRFSTFLKCFVHIVKICFGSNIPLRSIYHLMVFFCLMNASASCYNIIIFENVDKFVRYQHVISISNFSSYQVFRYFICILFTVSSICSAGFSIITPTKVYEMITMLMFMLVHGFYKIYMCALFSDELRGTKTTSTQYLEMKDEIEQYMQYKQLPEDVQKRLLEYYNFRYQKKYFREEKLMSALTENLRSEVMYHTYANVINSPVFENVSKELMGRIISCLKYEVYLPNDIVTRCGSVGTCMYFILRGTLAVYNSSGKEVFHLDDGDYFGELCLIIDSKRGETTMALEVSELLRMDKKDFRELIMNDENLLKAMESGITQEKTFAPSRVYKRLSGIFTQ